MMHASTMSTPMGLTNSPVGAIIVIMKTIKKLQAVVETREYIRQADTCMDEKSRTDFITYIAQNPCEGEIISGTGGARKIRWTSDSNQGKRGGSRVIYYYYDENMPIFLFTAYGKNQKENISTGDKAALKTIIKSIVKLYGEVENE